MNLFDTAMRPPVSYTRLGHEGRWVDALAHGRAAAGSHAARTWRLQKPSLLVLIEGELPVATLTQHGRTWTARIAGWEWQDMGGGFLPGETFRHLREARRAVDEVFISASRGEE